MAIGIGATARVITTAAAIMVVVFTSFVINPDPTVKMLAIGMAFAVLIDASLVRMCLVPSIMSLLGSRAWWMPRWLEPVIPHLELEGSTARRPPRPNPRWPAPLATRLSHLPAHPGQYQDRTTHTGPDHRQAGIAAAAGPWQHAGVAMGPRTRRLPGRASPLPRERLDRRAG